MEGIAEISNVARTIFKAVAAALARNDHTGPKQIWLFPRMQQVVVRDRRWMPESGTAESRDGDQKHAEIRRKILAACQLPEEGYVLFFKFKAWPPPVGGHFDYAVGPPPTAWTEEGQCNARDDD